MGMDLPIEHMSAFQTWMDIVYANAGNPPFVRAQVMTDGRWCYLPDFSGLECWAEPTRGQPHERFEISQTDLDAWQLLSRGASIAALLALTSAR